MKKISTNLKKVTVVIIMLLLTCGANAQTVAKKQSLAVFHLDSKGIALDPEQLGNLARIEIGKLDLFDVMDKYDVQYTIDKNNLQVTKCYGKMCLVEIGKSVQVDKILTGSVELYGETIVLTLRLIDVKENTTEKTQIKEFLNLPDDIQSMINISLCELFKLPVNTVLEQRLSKKYNYDNLINNPKKDRLNLSGPRMGIVMFTGQTAKNLRAPKSQGGYDAFPAMFQFGYQFETQYLNEGNFQALFEYIPLITGLDQGYLFPSLTILNGVRNNTNGYEFAFGPTFSVSKIANVIDPNTHVSTERLDSRAASKLSSSFTIACGKTFISGKLNFPVNVYFSPSRYGCRFGISCGYNAKQQ